MILLLAGLARALDCAAPVVPDAPVQAAISLHGHALGGLGLVSLEPERWSLSMLSPVGIELFTVSGPPQQVDQAPDAWAPWLGKIPFERDLRLAFTPVDGRCEVAGGHLRARRDGLVWRGPGGRASARREGDRVLIRDRRRGYTLTLVLPAEVPGGS